MDGVAFLVAYSENVHREGRRSNESWEDWQLRVETRAIKGFIDREAFPTFETLRYAAPLSPPPPVHARSI
jgi:hypothetical protein